MTRIHWAWIGIALFATGCSTVTYNSRRSASDVAQCIAKRWENSGSSGYKVPVSVERQERGYFVAFALQGPFFSPIVFDRKHPTYSVWAEVNESPSGSATEYHRAFQFMHKKIDRAVHECQEERHDSRNVSPTSRRIGM